MRTFMITGIEVFSVGTWNDDKYTLADLNEMVRAFNEIKEQGFFPYLKLGHNEEQRLLKEDGLPCAGWVENLYVKDDKLMADFSYIPEKIYQLIESGGYKTVSCEIYVGADVNGVKYPYMLGAIALLGADVPGVMNLDTILAMYARECDKKGLKKVSLSSKEKPKVYSQKKFEFITHEPQNKKKEGENMPQEITEKQFNKMESDLEKSQKALEAKDAELKSFKAKLDENDKTLAELKEFQANALKEKQKLELEAAQAKVDKFATELVSEKLCTPAMKPYVVALLGEEKKEYAVKVGDATKTLSKGDLLKETLKLFAKASEVNFEESTTDTDEGDKKVPNEDQMVEEANKYSKEHKVSLAEATKVVLNKYSKKNK